MQSLCYTGVMLHCVHGHKLLGHIYVVRQWNCYPPVTACSSMMFMLGHIWNNGRHQQHSIVIGQGYWTRMLDKIAGQVRRHSSTTSHSSYFVDATIWITSSSTFVNNYIIYYTDYSSAVSLVRIACRLSM